MKDNQSKAERFWEIDCARGLAVVLMVTLHFVEDLSFFKAANFQWNINLWYFWQRSTAGLFLLLVGISLSLSYYRTRTSGEARIFNRSLKRGAGLIACGLVVTIVTKLFLKEGYVVFGILHFIGIAVILSYPLVVFRYLNLFLGVLAISFGIYLNGLRFDFPWLVWAGCIPGNFFTVDYFPLFPWIGLVLIGLFIGNTFYTDLIRKFPLKDLSKLSPIRFLSRLGKNSLIIYLVHQPLFVGVILLVKFLKAGIFRSL